MYVMYMYMYKHIQVLYTRRRGEDAARPCVVIDIIYAAR